MGDYSAGRLVKRRQRDGSYQWQASIERHGADGTSKTLSKSTGIECDPPSKKDRRGVPSGKGSKQAVDFLTMWRDELVAQDAETATPVPEVKVSEVVRAYFDRLDVEPSTKRYYRSLLPHVDRLDCTVAEIDPASIRAWVDDMSSRVGSDMVLKVFDQVRAALDDAVYIGTLADNPMHNVKRPKRQRGKDSNPLPAHPHGGQASPNRSS